MNDRARIPNASADHVQHKLPRIYRLQSIERLPFNEECRMNRAVLFHEQASLSVEWLSERTDVRLVVGTLVSIRWLGRPTSHGGAIRISRLVPMQRPEVEVNIFETVPWRWAKDRELLKRAARLWETLSPPFRMLFNVTLWEADRFRRYLLCPSSLGSHHAEPFGNLRHSVETAEHALSLAALEPKANLDVVILAALIHDAGKADEYQSNRRGLRLSLRGELIGHRHTVIEWLAVARERIHPPIPEAQYLCLMHVITCAKGAPGWLGMREPRCIEAQIVITADGHSGRTDLMRQNAPEDKGFGRYHKHLACRPFVLGNPERIDE